MFYRFPNNAAALTKADVLALRTCDVVSFHHHNEFSFMNATKRESDTNPFETMRRVNCNTLFEDYGKREERISPKSMKCFEMEHNPRSDECWQTICRLMKEGDFLTLFWQRDALRTEALEKAGFCGDKLMLIITRDKKQFRFLIDTYVGRYNTARMIQGPRKSEGEF